MEEKKGSSATRAKNKYNTSNYDRISLTVHKGKKDVYQEAAKTAGSSSLNEFITIAIEEKIQRLQENETI